MGPALWERRPVPAPGADAVRVDRWEPRTLADLTAARRQLAALLRDGDRRRRLAPVAEEAQERLLLCLEELASNALRHGRPPVQVTVTAFDRCWLLEVSDAAVEAPPAPAVDRDAAEGGLGLYLVARIGGAHGWTVDGVRKVAWVRIDRTGEEMGTGQSLLRATARENVLTGHVPTVQPAALGPRSDEQPADQRLRRANDRDECAVSTPQRLSTDAAGAADPVRRLPGGGRVAAVRRLEEAAVGSAGLQRLAGLAARLFGTASAQVSLLGEKQIVAAGSGLEPNAVGGRSPLGDSLCTVTAAGAPEPLVVADAAADERVAALPPVTSGAVGSYLGVPLTSAGGAVVGALCVFDPQPRAWSDGEVGLLRELADSVATELELSALLREYEADRLRFGLAIDAAQVGTFDWDPATGILLWDERLEELFGYAPGEFDGTIAAFNARLHPDDVDRVSGLRQQAIDTRGEFSAEYRVLLPHREPRWVVARGRAMHDEHGNTVRLVGAAWDVTERRVVQERVSQIVEGMAVGFLALDRHWAVTHVNAEAERLTGLARADLLGRNLWELFPASVGSDYAAHYRRAADTGQPVSFDAYYQPRNAWVEVRVTPSPEGLHLYIVDVTSRHIGHQQLERAAARERLLNRITGELVGTLDGEEAVRRLSRLVVPAVADWCIVTLLDDAQGPDPRRGLRNAASWHVDPALRPVTDAYARGRLSVLREDAVILRALETGQIQLLARDATEQALAMLDAGPMREVIAALAPEAIAVLPLAGRTGPVGVLTLAIGVDRGPFTDEDLVTARHVAARAGLVLDNARLYRQQRDLAEGFQRSLLTEPPQPDHLQIAVRYVPAARAAQVGGDWYDALRQPSGGTVVVIGDVVGHDTAAAAAMGQIRSIVRTIGALDGDSPAALLRRVEQVMGTLEAPILTTTVVARLEQTDTETGGCARLRWSNAGHPPPLVLTDDGRVQTLTTDQPDLLLGVDPTAARREHEVTLHRDAVVLLYTDGLIERRREDLDQGLTRLRDTLAELAGCDLEALCDELLARMLTAEPDDDIALLAVRLHPQR